MDLRCWRSAGCSLACGGLRKLSESCLPSQRNKDDDDDDDVLRPAAVLNSPDFLSAACLFPHVWVQKECWEESWVEWFMFGLFSAIAPPMYIGSIPIFTFETSLSYLRSDWAPKKSNQYNLESNFKQTHTIHRSSVIQESDFSELWPPNMN